VIAGLDPYVGEQVVGGHERPGRPPKSPGNLAARAGYGSPLAGADGRGMTLWEMARHPGR